MIYLLFDWLRNDLDRFGLYRYLQVLDQVEFRAFAATALAFVLVLVLGRPVIDWLRRKKIGDAGLTDAEGLRAAASSKAATPTMGGVLIVGTIIFTTLLLADMKNMYVVLGIIVAVWLAALGGIDDWLKLTAASRAGKSRQGLYAWEKLVFQLGLGLIVGYFTYNFGHHAEGPNLAHVLNLPFQKTYESSLGSVNEHLIILPRWAYIALAVLLIAGMSNAVNISDGMDGLAGGISAAVALGFILLCLIAGKDAWARWLLVPHVPGTDELAIMAGAMLGACLGFLWFNCLPASVFMGDTGSLSLGGLIAYFAIVTRQEAVMLLMSTVFLIEIGSVVMQVSYFKATGGKRIFHCAPIHHHFHMAAWPESQIVVRFWILSVLTVVLALATLKLR